MTVPFTGPNPIMRNMERQRARIDQVRENSAREASCFATLTSNGEGELAVPEVVSFGATFVRQPQVAHGYSVEGELVTGRYPRAWGGVRSWMRDTRGFYTGCYVFLVVETGATISAYTAEQNYKTAQTDLNARVLVGDTGPAYYTAANAVAAAQTQVATANKVAAYTVHHDFRFSGSALKDLPAYLFDGL